MLNKIFIALTVSFCSLSFSQAAEADWEVLNFAITNPDQSDPAVVKNSVLNIISSFAPSIQNSRQATPTPSPSPTPTPTPSPTNSPGSLFPNIQFVTKPPPPSNNLKPNVGTPPGPYPLPYPIFISPSGQIIRLPIETEKKPKPTQPPPCHCTTPCNHPTKKPNLAEFIVDVPCPTSTVKPPKTREIIVKVPCPKTTKKPPPACECQCCPCNPCKPHKKHYKQEAVSEESIEEDTQTIYKSYEPVMKKFGEAKMNDMVKSRPMSYHPKGSYKRTYVNNDADIEEIYMK
ncbi:CLUMA_CG007304, isoform A [Clunio marinus]|uniref:CLUMA_CG007304, isoform A n=1 Tax=Clunio marinus TaxID=568069 RepID=A0A1J1I0B3_9DIPT|nr:CLUMA_CG007304, isoform A [Clunio marinus]